MRLSFVAGNSSGYAPKPKDTMTTSSVIGVNDTAGLELTVQVEKTMYSPGEPVNITFTLTNISNQTINFPMAAWAFDFEVFDDMNHSVFQYSASQIFPQVIWNVFINPGENLTAFLVWPQMRNTTAFNAGVPVSPGTYYIVGLIWEGDQIIVRTSPLQITCLNASVTDPVKGGHGGLGHCCYLN
jgi:hypothetical protein